MNLCDCGNPGVVKRSKYTICQRCLNIEAALEIENRREAQLISLKNKTKKFVAGYGEPDVRIPA